MVPADFRPDVLQLAPEAVEHVRLDFEFLEDFADLRQRKVERLEDIDRFHPPDRLWLKGRPTS